MRRYTVILKRPAEVGTLFSHMDHDIDVVVLHVDAHGPVSAAALAQFRQSAEDTGSITQLCAMKEEDAPLAQDYRVLAVFEGEHRLALTGWDLLS